jgi:hypothetical protein
VQINVTDVVNVSANNGMVFILNISYSLVVFSRVISLSECLYENLSTDALNNAAITIYSIAETNSFEGAIDFGYNALINIMAVNAIKPDTPITRLDDISPLLESDNIL